MTARAWLTYAGVRWGCLVGVIAILVRPTAADAQPPVTITVSGQVFATLADAVAAAGWGDTVMIGAGAVTLPSPLVIPSGISIAGASPHATQLIAVDLAAGIQVTAGDADRTHTTIRGLAISGAVRAIEVTGARGVVIRNVVLRDNHESGLHVAEDAEVTLVNGTLVRNGTGVVALGSCQVKNTIVGAGGRGLVAGHLGALVSSYNDLFGNSDAAYVKVLRGIGDLAYPVVFVSADDGDLHLLQTQEVTDRGDPADDFVAEPLPNGARVNMGAFGNTAEAELSVSSLDDDGGGGCALAGAPVAARTFRQWGPGMAVAGAVASLLWRRRGRERHVRSRFPPST